MSNRPGFLYKIEEKTKNQNENHVLSQEKELQKKMAHT